MAVAGRSLDRAKEFAARFSVTKAYGSYEQLAQDSDVDIVYVATIVPAHYDCCMKMFEYNKHILCEESLTMNLNQTKQLIETARSKKLFFMKVSKWILKMVSNHTCNLEYFCMYLMIFSHMNSICAIFLNM